MCKKINTTPDPIDIDSAEIYLTGTTHGNPNWWAQHSTSTSINLTGMQHNQGGWAGLTLAFNPNYHTKNLRIDNVIIKEKLPDGSIAELVQVNSHE